MKFFVILFTILISFSVRADIVTWENVLSPASLVLPIKDIMNLGISRDGKYVGDLLGENIIYKALDGSKVFELSTVQQLHLVDSNFAIASPWGHTPNFEYIDLNTLVERSIRTPFWVEYVNIDPITSRFLVSSMKPSNHFVENLVNQSSQIFSANGKLEYQVFSRADQISILGFVTGSSDLIGFDQKTAEIIQFDNSGAIIKRTGLVAPSPGVLAGAWIATEGEFVTFKCEVPIEGDLYFMFHVASGKMLRFLRSNDINYVPAHKGVLLVETEATALKYTFIDLNGREVSSFKGNLETFDPRFAILGSTLLFESSPDVYSVADVLTGVVRETKADVFSLVLPSGDKDLARFRKLDENHIVVGDGASSQIMKVTH